MAAIDYTPGKLLDFLREAPSQGLLNPAVARSRANAIEALFTELTDEERADLRRVDAERLAARAHKIQGSTIRPEAVALYKERVHEALQDYFAWLENPNSFASNSGHALRREMRSFMKPATEQEARALEDIALATSERRKDMVSVPLREGVTVYITHLPLDLSAAEAERLAGVVRALAVAGESAQ
ncbi:hypothetical protein M0G41_14940 [Lysobacter sp. CAU 1642]|uniref:HPt domain-containing protein n=2 Tax=Pseudomarimonas salicorniae TaxID=2933270 RepID=A0ABT0GKA6_9GAMM|nr:hypothetical protein [Lysobacter sp. CAU 1642]